MSPDRPLADRVAVRLGLCPVGTLDDVLRAIEARDAEARKLLGVFLDAYVAWRESWGVVTLPPIHPLAAPVAVLAPSPAAFDRLRLADEAMESYLAARYVHDPALAN
jgi:hypothetical protein